MHIEPLRTHIRCSISVLPRTWWSPAVGWMKACLQQPMFCSRESTNYLMIQQNEKSTQNLSFYWYIYMYIPCLVLSYTVMWLDFMATCVCYLISLWSEFCYRLKCMPSMYLMMIAAWKCRTWRQFQVTVIYEHKFWNVNVLFQAMVILW